MTRPFVRSALLYTAMTLAAGAANAQPPRHGFITVSGGIHAAGQALSERREFEVDQETASYDARHPFTSGVLVDAGFGVRIWKALGAGLSVSRFTSSTPATVEARIPHPFQFEALREFSGESRPAQRSETGVHVQLLYHVPTKGRLRAIVFGGPSYLMAEQDLVSGVRYDEVYPYDTATFASADLSRASGSGVGFNTGVDALWMWTKAFGTGALVRLTRASLDLDATEGRRIAFDAGGVHAVVGARVFF